MRRLDREVTWLIWNGGIGNPRDWECKRCGRWGSLPVGCGLTTLGKFVDLVIREHADCKEPAAPEPTVQAEATQGAGAAKNATGSGDSTSG